MQSSPFPILLHVSPKPLCCKMAKLWYLALHSIFLRQHLTHQSRSAASGSFLCSAYATGSMAHLAVQHHDGLSQLMTLFLNDLIKWRSCACDHLKQNTLALESKLLTHQARSLISKRCWIPAAPFHRYIRHVGKQGTHYTLQSRSRAPTPKTLVGWTRRTQAGGPGSVVSRRRGGVRKCLPSKGYG